MDPSIQVYFDAEIKIFDALHLGIIDKIEADSNTSRFKEDDLLICMKLSQHSLLGRDKVLAGFISNKLDDAFQQI